MKKKVVPVGLGAIEIVAARNLALASLRMLAEDPLAMAADSPFNPMSEYASEAQQRKGRIRKLLQLAESGKWGKLIEMGSGCR